MRFDLFWVLMGRTAYVFAPIYLIPFGYGFVLGDPLAGSFLALGVLTAILGMVFGNMGRSHMRQLSVEEGTLFLLSVWFLLAVLGMLPFHLAGLHLSPVDTFFECISALTTTGMTALNETLPPSLILWRALMSWFGGLLFIVILVSVLPVVSGCFGVDFTVRQERLFSPLWNRMMRPMREMTLIYIAITVIAVIIYLAAGDEIFPALILALFTISYRRTSSRSAAHAGQRSRRPALGAAAPHTLADAAPQVGCRTHTAYGATLLFRALSLCGNIAFNSAHITRYADDCACRQLRFLLRHFLSFDERAHAAGGNLVS